MPWTDQSSSFLRLLDYIWYTDIFPNQQKKEFNTGIYLLFSTWWSLYWFSSIVILCDQLPCVSLIYVFHLIRQIRYKLSCVVFETLARAISTFITLDGFLTNTFLYSEAVQHCGRLTQKIQCQFLAFLLLKSVKCFTRLSQLPFVFTNNMICN